MIRELGVAYSPARLVDLSRIDFEALRRRFLEGRQRTEAERLRTLVSAKLHEMVRLNRSRAQYLERLQRLIEEYNAGSKNVELFFQELMELTQELSVEEQRTVAEALSEEELALFDLLTKPEIELTEKERQQVKHAARDLLQTLKDQKLVLDWRKRRQSRAEVLLAIEVVLDAELPLRFDPGLYRQKCDAIYEHIYDSYYGPGQSIYTHAA